LTMEFIESVIKSQLLSSGMFFSLKYPKNASTFLLGLEQMQRQSCQLWHSTREFLRKSSFIAFCRLFFLACLQLCKQQKVIADSSS